MVEAARDGAGRVIGEKFTRVSEGVTVIREESEENGRICAF